MIKFLKTLNIKIGEFLSKYEKYILAVIAVCVISVSFTLAYKKYEAFEYGKFDLGNMSQVVWNTSRGNIYQVTDQFGSNVSRIAMSHFDPILILFAPIYWVSSNPMILVFLQHVLLISAIFPIYFLSKKLLVNPILAFIITLSYLFYAPLGYTLIWTEFHGISFVAPLIVWLVWYLEDRGYFANLKLKWIVIYSFLIVLMLMGKEEIGAILALFGLIIMNKNFKLGLATFLVSTLWFVLVFFVVIPAFSEQKNESVNNFLSYIGKSSTLEEDVKGENFFFERYAYLGDSYPEMIKGLFTKAEVKDVVLSESNKNTFIYLFGPFAFVPLLNVFTYIATPDYLITILSDEEIFKISNHRVSFMIFSIMLGYIYFLSFVANRLPKIRYLVHLLIFVNLFLCIYFTLINQNPLYAPFAKGIPIDKIIIPAFAQNPPGESLVVGQIVKNKKVDNTMECKEKVLSFIKSTNPNSYSGPDYIGAHTANMTTNAVFPAAGWEVELMVADYFEEKTYEPLDRVDSWTINKQVLGNIINDTNFRHVFSCDRMMVFNGTGNTDTISFETQNIPSDMQTLELKKGGFRIKIVESPSAANNYTVKYALQRLPGIDLRDKITFWNFVDESGRELEFVDYVPNSMTDEFDDAKDEKYFNITRDFKFVDDEFTGPVDVYYGMTNQLDGGAVYLGKWEL